PKRASVVRGLNSWRQVGEQLRSSSYGFQLHRLFIAQMITAFRNQAARLSQACGGLLPKARRFIGLCLGYRQELNAQKWLEGREPFDARPSQTRIFKRHVAQKKTHRTWFGNLPHLMEVKSSAFPVTNVTPKRRSR